MKLYDFEERKHKWLQDRKGKFTGSKISDLLGVGKDAMFDSAAIKYITSIAVDALTSYEENPFEGTWEMREGKRREPGAAKYYKSIIERIAPPSIRYEYYGDENPQLTPHPLFPNDAGASLDGLLYKDNIPYITSEYKCPKRTTHFERIMELQTYRGEKHFWLKEHNLNYYTQTQWSMMVTGANLCHWCSYNEFFDPLDKMILIEVPKDDKFCKNLDLRLKVAIKMKNEIINNFKNRSNG